MAGLFLLIGLVFVTGSHYVGALQTCETVDRGAATPSVEASEECRGLDAWALVPFAALAVLLVLPDYGEVAVGGVAVKRLENRLVAEVQRVGRDIRSAVVSATAIT